MCVRAKRIHHTTDFAMADQPNMDPTTKRDCPQCPTRTDNAPSLVREESCFPMVELGEALDIVDNEVRNAVHTRLRQLSYSRASQVNAPVCRGGTSQPTQRRKYHTQHTDFSGEDLIEETGSALGSATTGEGIKKGPNNYLGADSAGTAERLVETVGPPFLGRRVGSPDGVTAPFALPPFRASLVDGYALHIPSDKGNEVPQLYKTTSLRRSVDLSAGCDRENRVALKIIGEIRAGADLTGETVQPFRGHPHIWPESRGTGPNQSRRCNQENKTRCTEPSDEARHEEVSITRKCVYVTTGSPIPTWCNAVVPVENCEVDIDNGLCWPDNEALSKFSGDGDNIREIGTDAQAESLLLRQGQLVGPAEEGILAAIGLERLVVFRKLNVHTLALGDELQSRGAAGTFKEETLSCGDNDSDVEFHGVKQKSISANRDRRTTSAAVYDSNSPMLKALLSQHCPSTYVGQHHVLSDDVDEVERLLLALALKDPTLPRYEAGCTHKRSQGTGGSEHVIQDCSADVLVSTGGVSMGGSDCMKLALVRLQRKTLGIHPCLHINARCTEHLVQHKRQCLPDYAGTALAATSDCGDRANMSTGSTGNTHGLPAGTCSATDTASISDTELRAPREWSHTVETEIKFGRLNVKPGKPAMFAVLRVFARHSGGAESDSVEEPEQPLLCGKVVTRTTTQQATSKDNTFLERGHVSRDEDSGKPGRTSSSASGNVTHPFSPSEGSIARHSARSPVRVLLVFALPGNPCSAWVLFHLLVAPALNFYSSHCLSTSLFTHIPAKILAILDEPIVPDSTRPEYHRALVYVGQSKNQAGATGSVGGHSAQESESSVGDWTSPAQEAFHLYAFPTGLQISSRLLSCCASANGLILVPPSKVSKRLCIAAGEAVPVLLCGAPFPVRPQSLIDLVKLQNKLNGFSKTRCTCGGGRESPVDPLTPKTKNALSINETATRTDEAKGETPSSNVTSVGSLIDATGVHASHFERSQPVGGPVNLGIVIVSDRCYRGNMQDACADTLLRVLQKSSAVAALLELGSHQERPGCVGPNNVPSVRAEDDKIPSYGHTRDTTEKQSGQIRIVPDQIESIQEAVFRMLCTCTNDPEKLLCTDTDRALSRRSVVFVCGGTGLSPRDVTPQALLPLFTFRCSGIEHLLLEYSLRCTPLAALGRPCAGVIECGAGRQMSQGNCTDSHTSRGMSPFATGKGTHAPAPNPVGSPFEKCCTRTVSYAPKEPQGFDSVTTGKCCRHNGAYASQRFEDHKTTTARQCVPSLGKETALIRELPASAAALPESGTAGAAVEAGRVEVYKQPSGCGARCMVVVFPGSPKAVRENATALLPVLPHALEQL